MLKPAPVFWFQAKLWAALNPKTAAWDLAAIKFGPTFSFRKRWWQNWEMLGSTAPVRWESTSFSYWEQQAATQTAGPFARVFHGVSVPNCSLSPLSQDKPPRPLLHL
jgi:hypothetical protein